MAVSATDLARFRRMVSEPNSQTYSDADLRAYIERYPAVDERGVAPYYYDTATNPPTQVTTTGWYETWDLHAAAADVWAEKASALSLEHDITMPDGVGHRNATKYEQAMKQARYHASRRKVGTVTLIPWPSARRGGDSVIGNLAEVD